jgi:crotonobetainyl-CoA:carnitine CoA-transferase CaiB-like acyl-CoA transferase
MMVGVRVLNGVRVLDFSWIAAGPSGTLLLALAGADVIKIESRAKLDNYRKSFGQDGDIDRSMLFAAVNVGKRSVTIDAKQPEGRQLLLELVAEADVVVENFSPGAMSRLGLSFEDLREQNDKLVMISSSAAGQSGPKSGYSGFASIFSAQGGLASITRRPDGSPVRFGRSIDSRVGTAIAAATMIALLIRDQTGRGCHLDVSGQEAVAAMIGDVVSGVPEGGGRCFACQDGWLYVDTAEVPELEVDTICKGRSRQGAITMLHSLGLTATAVPLLPEIVPPEDEAPQHPWQQTVHPLMGPIVSLASPIRWSSNAGVDYGVRPAPLLGEHTDEVLAEMLGSNAAAVQAARDSGALQ